MPAPLHFLVPFAAAILLALAGAVRGEETVRFPSLDADLAGGEPTTLAALLFRPAGDGPFPAVVMLHGCAGMWAGGGRLQARERDWAERFAAAGFAALVVDSLRPRGLGSICRESERRISPGRERTRDAHAALAWLREQAWVRPSAIALVGWSNGGSTVLSAVDRAARGRPEPDADFRLAIAFYPGCRTAEQSARGRTRLPLTILMGEADDWTPIAPCREIAARALRERMPAVDLVGYAGAYHDFDAPATPLRMLAGLAFTADGSGSAHIGTDEAARADAIRRVMDMLAPLARP